MNLQVVDIKGNKVKEIKLNKDMFGITPNMDVISLYVRVFLNNQRQGTSSTKNRAEVSGSGRKPWRQKGTGNARVGSKRTPLWRHGGIVHGPRPKSWNLKLNKKVKKLAMFSALSLKASGKSIYAVEGIKLKTPNTKKFLEIIKNLNLENKKTLVVLDSNDINLRKSLANVNNVECALAENLNVYEVLNNKALLFVGDSLSLLEKKYESK